MIAVISDLHSNIEALTAVLHDIEEQGADDVYCLGDIIGYGPNPRECLDLAFHWKMSLMGNHEHAVLYGAIGFNPKAVKAINWTREELGRDPEEEATQKRWEFLGNLSLGHENDKVQFVHASPWGDPIREYVFPTDVLDRYKVENILANIPHLCFNGHTHTPGVLTEDGTFIFPQEIDHRYEVTKGKALINVGSVGQPRDGDPRSSYILYDEESVVFRRVPYPVQTTHDKIRAIKDLPRYLASRLLEGR